MDRHLLLALILVFTPVSHSARYRTIYDLYLHRSSSTDSSLYAYTRSSKNIVEK